MESLLIALACIFGGLAFSQLVLSSWFCAFLSRAKRPAVDDCELPFVTVVMPLRGADPELPLTLENLLGQDYLKYEVRIIVDSADDPAMAVIEDVRNRLRPSNLFVSVLQERRSNCGLVCSAISQGIVQSDSRSEVIVMADGDLVLHATGLRELVWPLRDSARDALKPGQLEVAATFGNRWYTPSDGAVGSWIRYFWNAGAVVPMHLFGIPWGGCMAIKKSALDSAKIVDLLRRAMVQDAPIKNELAKHGMALQFVPTLMMPNRESCGFGFAHSFIKRQMLWTKLYHPNFSPVFCYVIGTTILVALTLTLGIVSLWISMWGQAVFALATLLVYFAVMLVSVGLLEHGVRAVLRSRGDTVHTYSIGQLARLPMFLFLTQFVYGSATLAATLFSNLVAWRGTRYRIASPFNVAVETDYTADAAMSPNRGNCSL